MQTGESFVISTFRHALKISAPFDDVERFTLGSAKIAVSIDSLVGSTDIPPSMSLRDAARKAIVACVSDFVAKGMRPSVALVSVSLPQKLTKTQVRSIAFGFREASKEFKVKIIGGDTNESTDITINVCAIGSAPNKKPTRTGACIGDLIMTTGAFGYASCGLYVAMNTRKRFTAGQFLKRANKAFLRPTLPMKFCIKCSKLFTSSMDSSDGLAITLHELASQSKVAFELSLLPMGKGVCEFASRHKLDPLNLVLYGGEEYETVFTCKPSSARSLQAYAKKFGISLYEIGHVIEGRGVHGTHSGVGLVIKNEGWQHLKTLAKSSI